MDISSVNKKEFDSKDRLTALRAFQQLLEEREDDDSEEKKSVRKAVNDIILKKSDVGFIVTGLSPILRRLATKYLSSNKIDAANSALTLLRFAWPPLK